MDQVISDFGNVPYKEGKRKYKEIISKIIRSKHLTQICIIDNALSSFYNNVENLTGEIEEILDILPAASNEKNPPFRILLLHPNTNAAKQRNEDLYQNAGVRRESPDLYNAGLFKPMKKGIKQLHKTIGSMLNSVGS